MENGFSVDLRMRYSHGPGCGPLTIKLAPSHLMRSVAISSELLAVMGVMAPRLRSAIRAISASHHSPNGPGTANAKSIMIAAREPLQADPDARPRGAALVPYRQYTTRNIRNSLECGGAPRASRALNPGPMDREHTSERHR